MFANSLRLKATGVALGAVLLTAGLSVIGCTEPAKPVPSDDDAKDIGAIVQVLDNKFEPAEVEIRVGQAVRWEWSGRDKHDVVSTDRSFVSELMAGPTTYTHIFTSAGDFSYMCSIHPEMIGLVVVE